jgi:hypothetical protein
MISNHLEQQWNRLKLILSTMGVALSFTLPLLGWFLFFTLSSRDPIWAHLLYFCWLLLPDSVLLATTIMYIKYFRQNAEIITHNKKECAFYVGMVFLTQVIVAVNVSQKVYGLQTLRYWAQRLGY